MQKYLAVFFLSFLFFQSTAQTNTNNRIYPQTDFRPPLDLAPSLAGSFGEIRANHFHSGLDYRTNQREGYPVYAAADGYVSRLRVQIGGGGNIVYLTHANGYTTVYMHLRNFNKQIEQVTRDYQYRQQAFDVDFPLLPIEILVKKGDIIAWSGNTGGSAGPHLHFEIRDSKTEETINAQLFGMTIPDNIKPTISGIYAYSLKDEFFSETTIKRYFPVAGKAGNYQLPGPVISLDGETGFGIITYDQSVTGGNKKGVYSIELLLDEKTIYYSVLERFNFADSRAINSYIDYPALIGSGRTVQKSFIEPGNPLTIYRQTINRGLLKITDDQVHQIKYLVKDINGNTSTLNFRVKNGPSLSVQTKKATGVKQFAYNADNEYSTSDFSINITKGNLYSNLNFMYSVSAKPLKAYSKVHHVHTRLIPVHNFYTLLVKPDSSLKETLRDKAILVDVARGSVGGTFENGYIKSFVKYFGNFYVAIDTIAPVIRPVNIAEGKSMSGIGKVLFKISDNLSGINTFSASIDGQWVLMEYDQKTATLWHTFNAIQNNSNHLLKLMVTDLKSNTRTYTANFKR